MCWRRALTRLSPEALRLRNIRPWLGTTGRVDKAAATETEYGSDPRVLDSTPNDLLDVFHCS